MKLFLLVLGASLWLLSNTALAQTAQPSPGQSQAVQMMPPGAAGPDRMDGDGPRFRSRAAAFSYDRSSGRIEIRCAEAEVTRECVQAMLPLINAVTPNPGPTVVYATTSIKCGSTIYEVSTGTKGGNCSVAVPEGGQANSAGCVDGDNKSGATCAEGCGASSGSGSCTIKSAQ